LRKEVDMKFLITMPHMTEAELKKT